RYPAPRQSGADFRARITELVSTHDFDLIVPTCEEVFHLASPLLREVTGARLFAPDIARLTELHDKLSFDQLANKCGLNTPECHAIESALDRELFASESRNWVFKPRMSRFGEHTLVAPRSQAARKVPSSGWMAQRYVAGEEVCIHAVAHKGALVGCASYSSRWRMRGGASFAFTPTSPARHERLRELAATLVLKANLHGQFGFDVIFDEDDIPYLLECNPRATSGVHLLAGEGQLARAIANAHAIEQEQSQGSYLAPGMIVFGLPQAMKRGRMRQWWDTMKAGRDVISRQGNRLPLLGALIDAGAFALIGLRRGISTNAATTYDIEWNGEALS
ncbi:MAG: ATP-grasp domain-containing protein, partial [Pseudomonadota bacterium]